MTPKLADVHVGVAVDQAFVGVAFLMVDFDLVDGGSSLKLVCQAIFVHWFSFS